ncbi:1,4-alpha-glucan branching protein domain-containing protein [Paenibacillus ferrarius]|uniref:1,4-alpha-glucan branching protein domain-containing protein n=1 Tax=Paenibacillus ferrarius TaxID=1469647 RepID=UPI003D2C88E2
MHSHAHGYVAVLLHAHMPYIRHDKRDVTLEERWFFEAVTDTYLPLIAMLERLVQDNVPFRLTLSLSPTLLALLGDPKLKSRVRKHLTQLCELGGREVIRLWGQEELAPLAKLYTNRYHQLLQLFNRLQGDLIGAFRSLSQTGQLELITCGATHAFLPLVKNKTFLRAQLEAAVQEFQRHFGRGPAGIWLPECGYTPEVEPLLAELSLRYFVVEGHAHALVRGPQGAPLKGRPLRTPSGATSFARDAEAGAQVWSAESGYPGDPDYREYYRDIGYDLGRTDAAEWAYLKPYVLPDGARIPTGFKYYRVTGAGDAKQIYHPARAARKAQLHAEHFVASRVEQLRRLAEQAADAPPVIVCPYDAELFGHWWHEGLQWLEAVLRGFAAQPADSVVVHTTTLSRYAAAHPPTTEAELPVSSWGRGGYAEVWLQPRSQWVTPRLHAAEDRLLQAARRLTQPDALQQRALSQALRELMLAQSSDWTFILDAGTVTSYAEQRLHDHLANLGQLLERLEHSASAEQPLRKLVERLERQTPLLPELDALALLHSSFEEEPSSSEDTVLPSSTRFADPSGSEPSALSILMLAWEYPPHVIGGLARAVCELAKQLARMGHSIHVITCLTPDTEAYSFSDGVHIHRVTALPGGEELPFLDRVFHVNLAFTDKAFALADQGLRFDVLHAHDWLVGYAAQACGQELRLPLAVTLHATEHGRNRGTLVSPVQHRIHELEGRLASSADAVIVCSHYMAREVRELFPLDSIPVHVISNGAPTPGAVDTARAHTALPRLAAVLDQQAKAPFPLLVFLGRLVYEKGVHVLLTAFEQVLAAIPEARLVIAGTGPERDALEGRAAQLNEHVVFTGFIDGEDKLRLLQSASLCIFPSLYEPFGLVALEAMASGAPLLVSDTGGLAEIVRHGVTGYLSPPGDADKLAAAILHLWQHPEQRRELAERAKKAAAELFTWKKNGSLTLDVYTGIMRKSTSQTEPKQENY